MMSDFADIYDAVSTGDIGTAMDSDAWNAYTANALPGSGFDLSKINLGSLLSAGAGGLAGLLGKGSGSSQRSSGYQGKIPSLTANREQLPIDYDSDRRPGSAGRRYFSDMVYAPKVVAPAPTAPATVAPQPLPQEAPINDVGGAAHGGLIGYAQGGLANLGYYLGGGTDGMADKIPATIANKQPAKLSHGEFVISADVVSALGSGNSQAGAKVLYDMMDRVRKHAHGTKKQIKPANPQKTLPA